MWNELSNEFYFVATVVWFAPKNRYRTAEATPARINTRAIPNKGRKLKSYLCTHVLHSSLHSRNIFIGVSFSIPTFFGSFGFHIAYTNWLKESRNGWLILHVAHTFIRSKSLVVKTICQRISGLQNLLRWLVSPLSLKCKIMSISMFILHCFFDLPFTSIKVNASSDEQQSHAKRSKLNFLIRKN